MKTNSLLLIGGIVLALYLLTKQGAVQESPLNIFAGEGGGNPLDSIIDAVKGVFGGIVESSPTAPVTTAPAPVPDYTNSPAVSGFGGTDPNIDTGLAPPPVYVPDYPNAPHVSGFGGITPPGGY